MHVKQQQVDAHLCDMTSNASSDEQSFMLHKLAVASNVVGQSTGWVKRLTSSGLLHGSFHVGGAHHDVACRIQDHSLPWPLVQEQHLALPGHHVLSATPACGHTFRQDQSVSRLTQQHFTRTWPGGSGPSKVGY